MPLLELRNLAINAGPRPLLRGVNLQLQPGERVALRGPSGCGKTTLLRAICGLDGLASGEITLDNSTPHDWGFPQFRRSVIYLEQRPVMFEASAEANLRRPFLYGTKAGDFCPTRASEVMSRLQLTDVTPDFAARKLSQGQQQRLALIRALLLSPRVLLLDEPTSALDKESVEAVEELLLEKSAAGMSALIVTHDAAQAARWCHRVVEVGQWSP